MNWFQNPLIQIFGHTLLHSLWQLSAIAAVTYITLIIMRRYSANTRYLLCLFALLSMIAVPCATFYYLQPSPPVMRSVPVADISVLRPLSLQPSPTPGPEPIQNVTVQSSQAVKPLEAAMPYLVMAYLLGAILFFLRLGIGCLHIRRLRKSASPAPALVIQQLQTLKNRMSVNRSIHLFTSHLVDVPTVLGMFRTVILLPASAIIGLSPDHLHALLAHELAHIRRHDYLVNLLQSLLEVVLFYHPAIWWISAQIRQEREHCCDDVALTLCVNPFQFASALTSMESLRSSAHPPVASLALRSSGGSLLPRIRRLLDMNASPYPSTRLTTPTSILFAISAGALLVYFLGCSHPSLSHVSHENNSPSTQPTDADKALRARITSSLTDLSCDKRSLRDALNQLAATNDIKILVNWPALRRAGVSPEIPVSVSLQQMPVSKVLLTILASVPSHDVTLGYKIQDGSIIVSTRVDLLAGEPVETRIYDIRDFLIQPDPEDAFVSTNPKSPFAPATQPSSTENNREAARNKIVHELINTIEQTVAPNSWKDTGGAVGTIRELQGSLIISQSLTNLKGIENVLDVLRKAHDLMISVEERIVLVDEPTFQTIAAQYPLLANAASHQGPNISPVVLSDFELSALIQKIQNVSTSSSIAAPRVTLFNGQHAQIKIEYPGPNLIATRSSDPPIMTSTKKRQPTMEISMDFRSAASADRKSVAMNVSLELRNILRIEQKPAEDSPSDPHAIIQSPIYDTRKLNSLLSLESGTTALFGGDIITADLINPAIPGAPSNEKQRLLVLIRPKIIDQKDIEKSLYGLHTSPSSQPVKP